MKCFSSRLLASSGLVLLFSLFVAFIGSPAIAHDLHADHEPGDSATRFEATTITALVQAFRASGDDQYLDRAQAIIEPLLKARADDADVLINAALVAQARHEFSIAADLTRKANAIRPNDNQAWLLLASIHLVRGESAEAGAACRRLRDIPLLVSLTCQARVALVENNASGTFDRFARFLDVTELTNHDGDLVAWSFSVAGDLANAIDEQAQAAEYYVRSLELAESAQVRSALVDVLIEQGTFEAAAKVIDAGAPALPLQVRRMIVSQALGVDVEHEIRHADHEFRHWIADQDWLHAREMARFYMDVLERPALARRLAHINLGLQREPEDLLLAHRAEGCSSCAQ